MRIERLLLDAKSAGLILSIEGKTGLKISGDQQVIERLLPKIRKHKFGIIKILRHSSLKKSDKLPAWCAGNNCASFEEINLPKFGRTFGCVFQSKDFETWRALSRMSGCINMLEGGPIN